MIIGGRIEELRKGLGLSQAELARRVGVGQSTMHGLIKGDSSGSKHIHRIAQHLQTTPAYLEGETDDPASDAPPPVSRTMLEDRYDSVLVPVASEEFTLGAGGEVEDSFISDHVPFSRKWLRDLGVSRFDQVLLQPGRGDSMLPTINDRDLLLVDRARTDVREPGLIWSFLYAGQGLVKRLRPLPKGGFEAISDNPIHPPFTAAADEVEIVGQVLSAMRWKL